MYKLLKLNFFYAGWSCFSLVEFFHDFIFSYVVTNYTSDFIAIMMTVGVFIGFNLDEKSNAIVVKIPFLRRIFL